MTEECIFCKIIQGKIPAEKIYEDDKALVFLDIAPVNQGHALIVSKEHYASLLQTPEQLACHLMAVAKKVAPAVLKATNTPAFNLGINTGPESGQVIFHTHYHIIPRLPTDGLKPWPHKKYNNDEMQTVAAKIRVLLQ